jgi:hypothetical protein
VSGRNPIPSASPGRVVCGKRPAICRASVIKSSSTSAFPRNCPTRVGPPSWSSARTPKSENSSSGITQGSMLPSEASSATILTESSLFAPASRVLLDRSTTVPRTYTRPSMTYFYVYSARNPVLLSVYLDQLVRVCRHISYE